MLQSNFFRPRQVLPEFRAHSQTNDVYKNHLIDRRTDELADLILSYSIPLEDSSRCLIPQLLHTVSILPFSLLTFVRLPLPHVGHLFTSDIKTLIITNHN